MYNEIKAMPMSELLKLKGKPMLYRTLGQVRQLIRIHGDDITLDDIIKASVSTPYPIYNIINDIINYS